MGWIGVKDLMVPLSEYATVSEDATLREAVMALEKAQEEFARTGHLYLHRAVLVYDKAGKIVGKVSQLDVLSALEPKYKEISNGKGMSYYGFTQKFIRSMMDQYSLLDKPLNNLLKKASEQRVKNFVSRPTEGEYIEEDASLDKAIHQFVIGQHQSLLVTGQDEIVGILRLTDVFNAIFQEIKADEAGE